MSRNPLAPARSTPAGDFILKLSAGQPIPARVSLKGGLLRQGVEQTLTVAVVRNLYVHKEWACWDGKDWRLAGDLVGVDLSLALPSDAHPGPGEIALKVVDGKFRP